MSSDQNKEDLDHDVKPTDCPHTTDVSNPLVSFEDVPPQKHDWSSNLERDDQPKSPRIKEEQEEPWTSQGGVNGGPEPAKSSDPGGQDRTSSSSEPELDNTWDWEDTRKLESDSKPSEDDEGQVQGGRPFRCAFCGKCYPRSNSLKDHMKLHTQGKQFSCSVCHKTFQWKGGLERHMRIHTGEKPFSCYFCDLSFAQNSGLTAHLRLHTGEKPFRCNICKACFRVSGNLAQHMRLHAVQKPFSCSVCGKAFTQRGGLRRHATVHTGEKPFSCSICSKSFGRPQNLKRHLSLHEEDKPSEPTNSNKK